MIPGCEPPARRSGLDISQLAGSMQALADRGIRKEFPRRLFRAVQRQRVFEILQPPHQFMIVAQPENDALFPAISTDYEFGGYGIHVRNDTTP